MKLQIKFFSCLHSWRGWQHWLWRFNWRATRPGVSVDRLGTCDFNVAKSFAWSRMDLPVVWWMGQVAVDCWWEWRKKGAKRNWVWWTNCENVVVVETRFFQLTTASVKFPMGPALKGKLYENLCYPSDFGQSASTDTHNCPPKMENTASSLELIISWPFKEVVHQH